MPWICSWLPFLKAENHQEEALKMEIGYLCSIMKLYCARDCMTLVILVPFWLLTSFYNSPFCNAFLKPPVCKCNEEDLAFHCNSGLKTLKQFVIRDPLYWKLHSKHNPQLQLLEISRYIHCLKFAFSRSLSN